MTIPSSTYTRFDIPLAVWGRSTGDRFVVAILPAHSVFLSVPWIHPRLRRRVYRRGRRR
jgi:hypothetical protein